MIPEILVLQMFICLVLLQYAPYVCMLDKYEKVHVDLNKLLEIEPNDVSKDQPISIWWEDSYSR